MSWKQVADGNFLDATELGSLEENYIAEGQRGRIEIDLRVSVPSSVVSQLENELRQRGVQDVSVTTGSPMLRITYRKGFPWLAVIVAIVLGLIVLAILVIGWRFFREIVDIIPEPLRGVAGIAIVAGIILGLVVLAKEGGKTK